MGRFWSVPKAHPGETVVLIGGGPSLRDFDVGQVRGRARVITVNNAYQLAPWSDYHFFGDRRWWRWHGPQFPADYRGRIVTASMAIFQETRVLRLNRCYDGPLAENPTEVSGIDSGHMAINLAYHLGAARIVLLGYDMGFAADGESHWHPDHEVPSSEHNYLQKFAPAYPGLVALLAKRGVEVVRCTPSRLTCVPEVSLEDALA